MFTSAWSLDGETEESVRGDEYRDLEEDRRNRGSQTEEKQMQRKATTSTSGDLWDATYENPKHRRFDDHDIYYYRDAQGTPFEEYHYDDGRVEFLTPEDPLNPNAIDDGARQTQAKS